MRKAEKSKQRTKVSTSCGTSPIREVSKVKDAQQIQRKVKETGTSPPPQSAATQVGDTSISLSLSVCLDCSQNILFSFRPTIRYH